MTEERKDEITLKDHTVNALQASLLAIPIVGSSLEKLLFFSVNEKRSRRVEKTLQEIGQKVEEVKAKVCIKDNEDLANHIEKVLPQVSRANNETRRKYLRDLLFNAMQVPEGDPKWEEANIASQLIASVSDTGLSILADFHRMYNETDQGRQLVIARSSGMKAYYLGVANHPQDYNRTAIFRPGFSTTKLQCTDDSFNYATKKLEEVGILKFTQKPGWLEVDYGEFFWLIIKWAMDSRSEGAKTSKPRQPKRKRHRRPDIEGQAPT
ncbi:hypothetical protein [Aquisphaera insulae]|uniref:hypothetical protein n=1 Tax=Aquisphaera insulae TaxID=2712864 RepID=UPI0013EB9350|nr:hypothetical protein [Aquisphaera insulae]